MELSVPLDTMKTNQWIASEGMLAASIPELLNGVFDQLNNHQLKVIKSGGTIPFEPFTLNSLCSVIARNLKTSIRQKWKMYMLRIKALIDSITVK